VNTASGDMTVFEENQGDTKSWTLDTAGQLRACVVTENDTSTPMYRASVDSDWTTILYPGSKKSQCLPVGFHPDDDELLVAVTPPQGRREIHRFDPNQVKLGPAVVADKKYDVQGVGQVDFEEAPIDGPVRDLSTGKLAGWRYLAPEPTTVWFLPDLAHAQQQVDAALPNTINLFLGWSADFQLILVLATSTVDPGTYFLFVPAQQRLANIGPSRAWLPKSGLATAEYRQVAARDGLEIPVRLTWPAASSSAKVPLVVVLHDGPNRHMAWGFNPLIQCLAGQGYAVLEVDPRGSTGYGDAYKNAGRHEYGGAIETDIEDAVQSVLTEERIDATRVAILGQGIGGLSVCHALARSTIHYRCGITDHTPGDWIAYIEFLSTASRPSRVPRVLIDAVGDPEQDAARLRAISPASLASAIKVPLLLIEDGIPPWAPPGTKFSPQMSSSLRKTKPKPELFEQSYTSNPDGALNNRQELLERITAFLQRHLNH
jgi:pimeloyl-ACP methyl ester carboxylesterase